MVLCFKIYRMKYYFDILPRIFFLINFIRKKKLTQNPNAFAVGYSKKINSFYTSLQRRLPKHKKPKKYIKKKGSMPDSKSCRINFLNRRKFSFQGSNVVYCKLVWRIRVRVNKFTFYFELLSSH